MYEIAFETNAVAELAALRAFDGRKILAAIEEQLSNEPTVPTRNRKTLEGVEPSFHAVPPVWELRVGDFRVFYDVEEGEKKVVVRAVREKPPHKTTEEIV